MKRQIVEANVECERLRSEMVNMARGMDVKDEMIHRLERRIGEVERSPQRVAPNIDAEENHHLKHEIAAIKNENRLLRDKIQGLSMEIDRSHKNKVDHSSIDNEVRRLRAELNDKIKQNEQQAD